MKICFMGLELPEGKVKYQDERVIALDKKFEPKKVTPFYAEFIKEDCQQGDAFLVSRDKCPGYLLILDMEKLETRLNRTADDREKELLSRCLGYLEKELPLCDVDFSEGELALLKPLAPLSLKPTVMVEGQPGVNNAIEQVLHKAGSPPFFTLRTKKRCMPGRLRKVPTSSPAPARFIPTWPGASSRPRS